MREQEVRCFADRLTCDLSQLSVRDLLESPPEIQEVLRFDAAFIGGSGAYSCATPSPWLSRSLDLLREIVSHRQPTFASCWGFQALALALEGTVVTDPDRAEVGTLPLRLTSAGTRDPVFFTLSSTFFAHLGHEDSVVELGNGMNLLATSGRANQAFVVEGCPIYGTQFHPELDRATLLERLRRYPAYVENVVGVPLSDLASELQETPEANGLLAAFVRYVL